MLFSFWATWRSFLLQPRQRYAPLLLEEKLTPITNPHGSGEHSNISKQMSAIQERTSAVLWSISQPNQSDLSRDSHRPSTRPIDPDSHSRRFSSVASSLIARQVAIWHQIQCFVPTANIPTRLEHIESSLHPIWVSLCRWYSYIFPLPWQFQIFWRP